MVPARAINDVLYCERLCYLEWAQGELDDSRFTVEGRAALRRADQAGGELPPLGADARGCEMVELRAKLSTIIHHTEDQVLFVHVGLSEGRAVGAFSTMGRPRVETERAAIIV